MGLLYPTAAPWDKKIYGFLAKLTTAVEFDAVDDKPVDLIFALVVPQEKNDEHLSTLARIAAIMQTISHAKSYATVIMMKVYSIQF